MSIQGSPWVSGDELSLLVTVYTPPNDSIFSATRPDSSAAFSVPSTFFSTSNGDSEASLTSDALTLWYESIGLPYRSTRAQVTGTFPAGTPISFSPPLTNAQVGLARQVPGGIYFWATGDGVSPQVYAHKNGADSLVMSSPDGGRLDGYSISSDERTLYFSSETLADGGVYYLETVYRVSRADPTQPLGVPTPVTELSDWVHTRSGLLMGWVSDDDCVAYGAAILSADLKYYVVRATRGR